MRKKEKPTPINLDQMTCLRLFSSAEDSGDVLQMYNGIWMPATLEKKFVRARKALSDLSQEAYKSANVMPTN